MRNNVVVFLGFVFICLVNLHDGRKDPAAVAKPAETVRVPVAAEKSKIPADEKRAEAMR